MGLFGPKEVKKLDREVSAARIALSMLDQLPPDHQEHVLGTAPKEIRQAARAAAVAGKSVPARELLTAARANPPNSSEAVRWAAMIDEALAAL
jgi:hypothetical protein